MKSVEPPAERFQWKRIAATTFLGRCPSCGVGSVFQGFYRTRASCAHCDVVFERNAGNWTGPVVLSYGLATVLALVLGFALVLRFGFAPFVPYVLIGASCAAALLLHRFVKGWWVWLLWATGLVFADVPVSHSLRRGDAGDLGFLEEMLFEAFHWSPATPRPSLESFRSQPEFRKLLADLRKKSFAKSLFRRPLRLASWRTAWRNAAPR